MRPLVRGAHVVILALGFVHFPAGTHTHNVRKSDEEQPTQKPVLRGRKTRDAGSDDTPQSLYTPLIAEYRQNNAPPLDSRLLGMGTGDGRDGERQKHTQKNKGPRRRHDALGAHVA